ncbi:MAG: helix-turn-helix domain-containing protein [Clostridia bacterium]|nr:helix-turn-helix domain-containing protein [Clostridia bacterium]
MNEKKLLSLISLAEIKISRARYVELNSRWNFTTSGAPYSRLYFVSEGGGFLKTKSGYTEMEAGKVYFIPAGCAFSCGCERLCKVFFHISISTPEKYSLFSSVKEVYSLPYSVENIEKMREMLKSDNYLDVIKLKESVLSVLLELCDKYSFGDTPIKKHSELVSKVIDYIDGNLRINLKVADIAKATFSSESKIRNSFLSEMGIPIGKYIDDMVFFSAMNLLSEKENSVADVAARLGFCDQFYLSRRFKERMGVSPREFKKIHEF